MKQFKKVEIDLNCDRNLLLDQCLIKLCAAGASESQQDEFIREALVDGYDSLVKTAKQWFTCTGNVKQKKVKCVRKVGVDMT